jgi:hypothetical protein
MKRVGKKPGPLSLCSFPGGVQNPLQQVLPGVLLDLAARKMVEGICENLPALPAVSGNESVLIGFTSPDRSERAGWPSPMNVAIVSLLSRRIV